MDMIKACLLFCKAVQDYNAYFCIFEFETDVQKDTFIFQQFSFNLGQTYLNKDLKTQNVEQLTLDLIFHNHF